jgi:hypothetical protein
MGGAGPLRHGRLPQAPHRASSWTINHGRARRPRESGCCSCAQLLGWVGGGELGGRQACCAVALDFRPRGNTSGRAAVGGSDTSGRAAMEREGHHLSSCMVVRGVLWPVRRRRKAAIGNNFLSFFLRRGEGQVEVVQCSNSKSDGCLGV